MRKIAFLLAPLAGCATVTTTPPPNCMAFIPPAWLQPVPGYPLPAYDELKSWQTFGVGQTGQLEKANGRAADTVHIFSECERRANEARPRKRFLGIF